ANPQSPIRNRIDSRAPLIDNPAVREPRLIFVTGKGGVGKTTVAAAIGVHLASARQRVLLVETDQTGRLGELFDAPELGAEPAPPPSRRWCRRARSGSSLAARSPCWRTRIVPASSW